MSVVAVFLWLLGAFGVALVITVISALVTDEDSLASLIVLVIDYIVSGALSLGTVMLLIVWTYFMFTQGVSPIDALHQPIW